jgi:hypothetical protein
VGPDEMDLLKPVLRIRSAHVDGPDVHVAMWARELEASDTTYFKLLPCVVGKLREERFGNPNTDATG